MAVGGCDTCLLGRLKKNPAITAAVVLVLVLLVLSYGGRAGMRASAWPNWQLGARDAGTGGALPAQFPELRAGMRAERASPLAPPRRRTVAGDPREPYAEYPISADTACNGAPVPHASSQAEGLRQAGAYLPEFADHVFV